MATSRALKNFMILSLFICLLFCVIPYHVYCLGVGINNQDLNLPLSTYYRWISTTRENLEEFMKYQYKYRKMENYSNLFSDVRDPVIVWWTPVLGIPPNRSVKCGQLSCHITIYREFREHPLFKGFVFYGTFVGNLTDFPLPRNESSVFWALYHEDVSCLNMALNHVALLSLFNYTATFSRYSSFPLTTQFLDNLDSLTSLKYFVTTALKNLYQKDEKWWLAPVLYIQSNCDTSNDRDSYVAELSKFIRVDSYGACLHNRNLPPRLQYPHTSETVMSDENMHLLGKYKFTLAIESMICDDYVSEKLWRPLISGSVPIYIGSPSIADWLPNNHSAILALDFKSPKELAEYLLYLDSHDEEYDKYLLHKHDCLVTNNRLIHNINRERWQAQSKYGDYNDSISGFECFLCHKAHQPDTVSIATSEHYDCHIPVSVLSRTPNKTNGWLDAWLIGLRKAELFRSYVDSGASNITDEEFNDALKNFEEKLNFNSERF